MAVYQALKDGRLTQQSATKRGHRWQIDVEAADREWVSNTRADTGGDHRSEVFRSTGVRSDQLEALRRRDSDPPSDHARPIGEADLVKIQYREKLAAAQWKEIRAAALAGRFVPKEEAAAEYRRIAQSIHEAIRSASRRVGTLVAIESNAARCSRIIEDAMFQGLLAVCEVDGGNGDSGAG